MDPLDQRIKAYFQSIEIPEGILQSVERMDSSSTTIKLQKPIWLRIISSSSTWIGFGTIIILIAGFIYFRNSTKEKVIKEDENMLTASSLIQVDQNVLDQWLGKYYADNDRGGLQMIIKPEFLIYQKDFWNYSKIINRDTLLELHITNLNRGFRKLQLWHDTTQSILLKEGESIHRLTTHYIPVKYVDFPIDSSFEIDKSIIRGLINVDAIDPMLLSQIKLSTHDYYIPVNNKPLEITKDGRFELTLDKTHSSEVVINLPNQLTTSIFINPGQEIFISLEFSSDSVRPNLEFMSEYTGFYDKMTEACWQNQDFLLQLVPFRKLAFNFTGTDMSSLTMNINQHKNLMMTEASSRFQMYPSSVQRYFHERIKNHHLSLILFSPISRRSIEYQHELDPIPLPYRFYSLMDTFNCEDLEQIHYHSYYQLLHHYRSLLTDWTRSTEYLVGKTLNLLDSYPLKKSEKNITIKARQKLAALQDFNHSDLSLIEELIINYGEDTIRKKINAELEETQATDAKNKIGFLMRDFSLLFQLVYYASEVIDFNPLDSVIRTSLAVVENIDPTLRNYFESKIEARRQYYNGHGLILPSTIKWLDIPADSINVVEYISSRFPGQVIVVSFWGSWDGTSLAQMPTLNLLKRKLKNKPVTFVYFALDSKEKKTKITIAEQNMDGLHYICTPEQKAILNTTYDLNSIPRFMIINQNGKLVNGMAPRPTYGNQLYDELIKILQK